MLFIGRQRGVDRRCFFYGLFIVITILGFSFHPQSYFISSSLAEVSQKLPLSHHQQQKLKKAIALIVKTAIGKELKPFITELVNQDKIQLTTLLEGHYGESGEGCTVKETAFYYEGFFILLSDKLSIEEIASALVHEISHYRMIQERVQSKTEQPEKVIFFEISAFSAQYQFVVELERLKLVNRHKMFVDEAKTVLEIMQNSYQYKKATSPIIFDTVFKQLVDYGYPEIELNRLISQRSKNECIGPVN